MEPKPGPSSDTIALDADTDAKVTPDFFEFKKDRGVVKHAILKRYFDAWLPIVTQSGWYPVYIDGFAGPGRHKDGEDGSPLVTYKAAVNHSLSPKFKNPLQMIFIEFNKGLADELRDTLAAAKEEFKAQNKSTDKVKYEVRTGKFREEMEKIFADLNDNVALMAFVDPFGFNGEILPMELMRKIMCRAGTTAPPTEVFINVMDGFANRFFNCESRANAIHTFLGTDDWKVRVLPEGLKVTPAEKIERFMEIYIEQLSRDANETHVELFPLKFGMRSARNRHIYTLLFITRHDKGLEAMKGAMWKQTQFQDGFQFSEFIHRGGKGKEIPGNFNTVANDVRRKFWVSAVLGHIMEEFSGKGPTHGHELEKFIMRKTIYLFNVKQPLKKELKKFITKHNSRFDNIVFEIPTDEEVAPRTLVAN